MPIYMDRHDVSESVTAENVAELHQADLKIQHKFGCRGLTYWFDEKRKTAFCLVEAPDKETVQNMHDHAHGVIAHRIIEVDTHIVESFLGRIEDPERAQNTSLNIINDPAFRTIMVLRLKTPFVNNGNVSQLMAKIGQYHQSVSTIISQFIGRIVKQDSHGFLVSFESVTKAVLCSLSIQDKLKELNSNFGPIDFTIGLSSGVPVTDEDSIFADTIKLADRMCDILNADITVSAEVKELYKSENSNSFFDTVRVKAFTNADERFVNLLMDYFDMEWRNSDLKVADFHQPTGYSKSQLNRKMNELAGISLNTFLKEYRLAKAFKLLNTKAGNVSEIAFQTGFSSPSYFAKCFIKRYGVTPSEHLST